MSMCACEYVYVGVYVSVCVQMCAHETKKTEILYTEGKLIRTQWTHISK